VFATMIDSTTVGRVNALAQQLEARIDVVSGPKGTTVSVSHATFSKAPEIAPNGALKSARSRNTGFIGASGEVCLSDEVTPAATPHLCVPAND
jgi:hypothetical protein